MENKWLFRLRVRRAAQGIAFSATGLACGLLLCWLFTMGLEALYEVGL